MKGAYYMHHFKPWCPPSKVFPAVCHPTKHCVNKTFSNNIVPHIWPTHTTNIHHENFQHVNYFPQTQSNVTQVTHQNFIGTGPVPTPFGGGFGMGGPGFGGSGFGGGPGFGMGGPFRKK